MHNPESAALELAEKLASRNRHVTYFLGAGASCSAGLPDLRGLKVAVNEALEGDDRASFQRLAESRNIEEILSRLRIISEVLKGSAGDFDGFSEASAKALDKRICSSIATTIHRRRIDTKGHERFARWLGLSRYSRPIEIFTTNYDILIEQGLELAAVPYFDGFVGNYRGRFRADLVDSTDAPDPITPPPRWVRVWKLHGSISWILVKRNGGSWITRRTDLTDMDPEDTVAVYPSLQKYQESRRIPFVVLGDRFRRSLAVPETLCIVSGYSFGDEDINELLYEAARVQRASEVLALFHADIPQKVLEKARVIPNFTVLGPTRAVIGAIEGEWQRPEGDTLFWTGGAFKLGNFATLTEFLLLKAKGAVEVGTVENTET